MLLKLVDRLTLLSAMTALCGAATLAGTLLWVVVQALAG